MISHGCFLVWKLSVCLNFHLFVGLPLQLSSTTHFLLDDHCTSHRSDLNTSSSSKRQGLSTHYKVIMASDENTSVNSTIDEQNTPVNDVSHEVKHPTSRDVNALSELMAPLKIQAGNVSSPVSLGAGYSPAITSSSEEKPPSAPEMRNLDPDDQSVQSDAELSEVESTPDDSDHDDYDFTYEDDDDVSLDDDPFFGDAPITPGQPTEEQLEAIRKVLEQDKAEEARKKALKSSAPVDPNDMPDLIEPHHPLLKAQNYNATDMLISIRSSYGGDVFHVIGMTEPLLEMKLKFIQAVDLPLEALHSLEFLCGYHVIKDDDTAEKVCYSIHHYCTRDANMAAAQDWNRIDHPLPKDWRFALRSPSRASHQSAR